jgi:hypothetical protein
MALATARELERKVLRVRSAQFRAKVLAHAKAGDRFAIGAFCGPRGAVFN